MTDTNSENGFSDRWYEHHEWREYRRLIIATLRELREDDIKIEFIARSTKEEVVVLKTKMMIYAGVVGTITGFAATIIGALMIKALG